MIEFRDFTLARAGRTLIEGLSLQIHPGQKVGLTGANGCGKSTLLAALRGELAPERGSCTRPAQWIVAHVAQETPAVEASAIEWTLAGDVALAGLRRAIAAAEASHDGEALARLHEALAARDGYRAEARAATLLAGLGFAAAELARPVAEFSGGWRMRLELARALMAPSDLLLLDEPTNHLDLDAIVWLERWLAGYRGTLLMVSHDRDFLDATVDAIAHVEQGRLGWYRGGYSNFERIRAERLAVQQASHEAEQRRAAELRAFVDRFRAQATKARQAQSRLKALERLQTTEAVRVAGGPRLTFPAPLRNPERLLSLDAASIGHGGQPLLTGVNLGIARGERIGILGRNGAGKTTLTRALAGLLPLLAGERVLARDLLLGYFAQHQIDELDLDASPLLALRRIAPAAREQDLRDWLGRFGFGGERVEAPIRNASGGEKARLAFALVVYPRPNLLLLDEPTNHLDLGMREALAEALADFAGAVVLISHDRHLLASTVDTLYLVDAGRVQAFDGDLADYARWSLARQQQAGATGDAAARAARRAGREGQAAERQARLRERRPLEKELEQVERRLTRLAEEQATLDATLADPALYASGNGARVAELTRRKTGLVAEATTLEERWLELGAALEALC
jgi:ATP-binding cassette subfamily F protein 3